MTQGNRPAIRVHMLGEVGQAEIACDCQRLRGNTSDAYVVKTESVAVAGPRLTATVVNRLDDLVHDPHLNSVDFWQIHQHPSEGALRVPRVPIQMSGAKTDITRLPPQLGQHTQDILRECGFDDGLIARWTAEGGPCHAPGS